ncbi:MAG: FHA domain-containing protein [Bdellovibrionota bacterium]
MATLLEVLDEGIGRVFHRLNPGIKIGRSKGDIIINDPNISSLHAMVEMDNKQALILTDLDSANGLLINGRKVKKIALLPGVTFQIGKTLLRIKEVDEIEAERLAPLRSPQETFIEDLEMLSARTKHPEPLVPKFFSSLVELEFTAGIDAGKLWKLTYGPRTLGFLNMDLSVRDPSLQEVALEIYESDSGIVITNKSPNALLNDKVFTSSDVKSGDVITIGTTQMKLSLKPHDK